MVRYKDAAMGRSNWLKEQIEMVKVSVGTVRIGQIILPELMGLLRISWSLGLVSAGLSGISSIH